MEFRPFLADLTAARMKNDYDSLAVTIYEIMPGLRLQIIDAANGIENKLERRPDSLAKIHVTD
jgi:hypothetical protein